MHQNDTTKKPTASPGIRPKVSGALDFGRETSYGSSNLADEDATQGEPLMKVHHPALAVRRRQESEEQGPAKKELIITLRDLYEQGGPREQKKIAKALELIREGVDLEMRSRGETALHLAVRLCHSKEGGRFIQILHELLQAGADVEVRNSYGQTALHTALNCSDWSHRNHYENKIEAVKLLLRYKADVNAKDRHSLTPLHRATMVSSGKYIDVMLAAGARVNERSDDGSTALHEAVDNYTQGKIVAKKLIRAGINMDITTNYGMTALDVAHDKRNSDVVEAIEEAQEQLRRQRRKRRSQRTSHS